MKDTARSPWRGRPSGRRGSRALTACKNPSRSLARPFRALRPPPFPRGKSQPPSQTNRDLLPVPPSAKIQTKPKEKPRSLCKSRCGRRRGGLAPRRGDPGARTPGWGGRCISTARTRGEFRHPPPRSPPPARPRALRACGCCGSRVLPEGGQRGRVRRASGEGGRKARRPGCLGRSSSPGTWPFPRYLPPRAALAPCFHPPETLHGEGTRPPREAPSEGRPPAGRRSLRRAGARRPWCRESTPGRDALREGSVARRHCPSARAGHPRPAGT